MVQPEAHTQLFEDLIAANTKMKYARRAMSDANDTDRRARTAMSMWAASVAHEASLVLPKRGVEPERIFGRPRRKLFSPWARAAELLIEGWTIHQSLWHRNPDYGEAVKGVFVPLDRCSDVMVAHDGSLQWHEHDQLIPGQPIIPNELLWHNVRPVGEVGKLDMSMIRTISEGLVRIMVESNPVSAQQD